MKNTLLVLLTIICFNALGQAPQMVNYQTVVRDNQGLPISNTQVSLRFTIHDGTETGPAVFTETQTATTNQFGLASVKIGQSGSLAVINWGLGSKYLQVEADINNNGIYSDMGSAQLLSVPYALFASNSSPGATGPTGPAGSGIVSGTTNYIAKFTPNGNSVGNSNAYDNGTDIGIGTTLPAGRLDIHAKSTSSYPQLRIYDDSVNGYARIQYQNAGSNKYWQTYGYINPVIPANSRFNFWNSVNSDVISITGDGKLGVGTNNPNVKIQAHSTTNSSGIQLSNSFTGSQETDGSTLTQDGNSFVLNNYESGPFIIKSGFMEHVRISNLGNVGIGDTQLLNKLTVVDNTDINNGNTACFIQTGYGTGNTAIRASNYNTSGNTNHAIYAYSFLGNALYGVTDGYNGYGVYGICNSPVGYGVYGSGAVGVHAESSWATGTALEIEGAVKATGSKFIFQTQALTAAGTTIPLTYANQSNSDMLFITPVNDVSNHTNTSCSVFWNGTTWEIQSGNTPFPAGVKFNVMLLKRY